MKAFIAIFLFVWSGSLLSQNYTSWRKEQLEVGDTLMFDHLDFRATGLKNQNYYQDTTIERIARYIDFHKEIKSILFVYHTDCRGSSNVNKEFSQKRVDFFILDLTTQLQDSSILFFGKGAGEEFPRYNYDYYDSLITLSCDFINSFENIKVRDQYHRENRRFEMIITEIDTSKYRNEYYSDFEFSPIEPGRIYPLNVAFHLAKNKIQSDSNFNSRDSLQTAINFLRDHMELNIEVRNHTDCRGSKKCCSDLSGARAKAAADLLFYSIKYNTKAWYPKEKIQSRGFGEMMPFWYVDEFGNRIELNCDFIMGHKNMMTTEKYHQMNRRTEFIILPF